MTYQELLSSDVAELREYYDACRQAVKVRSTAKATTGMTYWLRQLDMTVFVARRRGIRLVGKVPRLNT